MAQSKAQKKRLIEAKRTGTFKKAKFSKIVEAVAKSDIEPRLAGQTKREAGEAIAGSIKAKQIKKFGSKKVNVGGKTRIEVAV